LIKDQFEREEAWEAELLQKRLIEEQKENLHRKYLQICKSE
jgi:hypothetical protein